MESFHWDQHFVTGLTEVDKQHHHLVDVINQFGELLSQSDEVPFEEIEKVFSELAAYAQYHFSEEESLMDRIGLDPRHQEHHRREHVSFLHEVTQMHTTPSPAKESLLLQFLVYWLAYHILGSDQSMAKQIVAIRSGISPAEAYMNEERIKDSAVGPLLHALTGLFRQVTERNHELHQLNQTLETRVAERTQALALANQQLEEIALTDVLTGLPNRRHAMRRLALAWDESSKLDIPLSCMMVDADGFKQVNDNYGHDAGDEVLRQLSRHLRYAGRTDDIVCRLGGDEFFVICPGTPLEGALRLAEKMRAEIAALRVPTGNSEWRGSVSIGVAARKMAMQNVEELVKAADKGVYLAKQNGRNCVATAP